MNFYRINKETQKVEVLKGIYRAELVQHYKSECSPRETANNINNFAPEVKGKSFIPKPALQKVINGIGYICEEE